MENKVALVVLFVLLSMFSALPIRQASSVSSRSGISPPLLGDAHAEIVDTDFQQQYTYYASNVDIINPLPGQYANYSHNGYYENGTISFRGWWSMSYLHYVEPHLINATHTIVRPVGVNGTYWLTIDKTDRWVLNGSHWWKETWYVAWIETNVTIGSVINWWTANVTIGGSRVLSINGVRINTWFINLTYPGVGYDLWYYDKQTGVLVAVVEKMYDQMVNLTLTSTDIPIGGKLSTAVYFNLNPNPASVGETLTLKGILVDQFSQPLANETVELYARSLVGSWRYITSLTTNEFGIFVWQATIPSVTPDVYVIAIYYPGSGMYESTYNLAALVIQ